MTDEEKKALEEMLKAAEAEIRQILSCDAKQILERKRAVHPDPPVTFPPFARVVAERLVEALREKLIACLAERRYGDAEPLINGLKEDMKLAATLVGIENTSLEIDSFNNAMGIVLLNMEYLKEHR